MTPAPDPPLERSTKIRWGFVVVGTLFGVLVLVSVRPPEIRRRGINAAMTASWLQATGLHKALMLYAHDHDGQFPEGKMNANEAYRQLFPDYLQEERPFYVPRSAWHNAARGQKPDDDIGSPPAFEKALEKGENHWAYVSGLGTQSDGQLPVIADGFVEGSPGMYTDDPSQKGGVWKGTKASWSWFRVPPRPNHFPKRRDFACGAQIRRPERSPTFSNSLLHPRVRRRGRC